MKIECTQCKKLKSLDEFYKRKRNSKGNMYCNKDGHSHKCIDCYKQYRKDNKDRIDKYNREYHLKNKDKINKRHKEWQLNNKDRIKQYSLDNKDRIKQYQMDNKDKIRKTKKADYLKHIDRISEYNKEYKLKNKDIIIKIKKNWQNSDMYMKKLLTLDSALSTDDIPDWLMKAKRSHIELKRITQKEK